MYLILIYCYLQANDPDNTNEIVNIEGLAEHEIDQIIAHSGCISYYYEDWEMLDKYFFIVSTFLESVNCNSYNYYNHDLIDEYGLDAYFTDDLRGQLNQLLSTV